jgi:plasmid replication initiation protein
LNWQTLEKIGVLDAEYQRMYDLKIRFRAALKQINEHTDITASYEQHKKGRTITGFSFKFKQKKKTGQKRQKQRF